MLRIPQASGLILLVACGSPSRPPAVAPSPTETAAVEPETAPTDSCSAEVLTSALAGQLHAGETAEITFGAIHPIRRPEPGCAFGFLVTYPEAGPRADDEGDYVEDDEEGDYEEGGSDDEEEPPTYFEERQGAGIWVVKPDGALVAQVVDLEPYESSHELAGVADFDGDGTDELLVETSIYGEKTLAIVRWTGKAFEAVLELPLRSSPDGSGEEDGAVVCLASYEIGQPAADGTRALIVDRSIEGADDDQACKSGREQLAVPTRAASD